MVVNTAWSFYTYEYVLNVILTISSAGDITGACALPYALIMTPMQSPEPKKPQGRLGEDGSPATGDSVALHGYLLQVSQS